MALLFKESIQTKWIELWKGDRVIMRSGVVEGLQQQANGTHLRTLTVELLTGETILISTEGKTTCSAIWNRVQGELVARGVIHPQIFGLAIKTGFDWVFVDPDAKVSKYFVKDWKTTTAGSSSSINETKTLILYCRVHFYLESVPPNFDIVSLLHYYLQLRQNLTTTIRRLSTNLVQTLAYAFQAELGDWAQCQVSPPWSHSLIPGVSSASAHVSLIRRHQALVGLGQIGARTAFIRSLIPTYNMHLYGMNLRTKDGKDTQAWIGVTPKGIEVYQNELSRNEIPEQPRITFLWANITKLYFERKKFEIRGRACSCGGSSMEKLTFTSWSESVPRHLLLLCRSTHQFHLSNHKILLPPANGTGGGDYRTTSSTTSTGTGTSGTSTNNDGSGGETPCNSTLVGSKNEDKMLDLSLWAEGLLLPNGNESSDHQRVSVISNASSNNTSGIVSDRVYSLDGSEEDLEMRISECCTDHTNHSGTNNSTSLESLSHKPSKPHHLSLKPHHCNGIQRNHHGIRGTLDQGQEGSEADVKFWYCDSDCEDDDCDTGPCRSLLVRTINDGADQKDSCAAFCECNSCLADEDFERESSSGDSTSNQLPSHHHNTPSLASEKTLKAVDITIEDQPQLESSIKLEENGQVDQQSAVEHVYGEISDDPKIDLKGEYSTIENEEKLPPKPKPRCLDRDPKQVIGMMNNRNDKHRSPCGHKKQKGNESGNTTVAAAKETSGLTPKVASLKYLRTQRVSPWNRTKCPKEINRKGSMGSLDEADGCYIEFGKTVHQGRYPSTRTVSDNFDTDSDYVQLPPLLPRRPPPKRPTTCNLWKFVKGGNAHHKSCGNVAEESNRTSPVVLPPSVVSTLPRRVPTDSGHQVDQIRRHLEKISMRKTMSKSTNAINSIHQQDERPPKPPPKPKKLPPGSELPATTTTQPVDARFITSKPQILIQTAYATPATIASPGQAQILFRHSQVPIPMSRRTQSHIVQPTIQHSQSMDNIYDTVATEESTIISKSARKQVPLPPLPPPLLPKPSSSSSSSVIIRPNNYIDVHASSPARRDKYQKIVGSNVQPKPNQITNSLQPPQFSRKGHPPVVAPPITGKNRCGSVPNNLHTFYVGLQNLKPLSRAPIVYPMATSCSTLKANGVAQTPQPQHHIPANKSQMNSGINNTLKYSVGIGASGANTAPRTGSLTTLYTSHLSRSQIQQFKAQLYSDMDYVIFPPKDPRLSQQEYSDSRSLSHTTMTSTNSNPMLSNGVNTFSMNDIVPPYLPPPPPYSHDSRTSSTPSGQEPHQTGRKPQRPLPGIPISSSVYSPSNATGGIPHQPNSYTSLYTAAMSSNASQCSSSQYGGCYAMGTPSTVGSESTVGLNAENLQKFLSTQSLTGSSHLYSPPPAIYYPASTHSAPPLPPYKTSNQVLIENGMRKAVQRLMANKTSLSPSDDRIRMKLLSRSEESLYSQPVEEAEEKLQAIYNLPPPPPYKKKPIPSPSEVDLTSIRQKCTALELPLLKALLNSSDGALITNQEKGKGPQTNSWKQNGEVKETLPPARPPKPTKQ